MKNNNDTNSYTWDRANRLLSMGSLSYQYDGLGNRIQQKTGDLATRYLLDVQPGLAVILRAQDWDETDPGDPLLVNTTSYVHSPRGIHAQETMSGWEWMVQDGLGSVRGVVDNGVGVLESRNYDPYGELFGATGSSQTSYGFTGEPTDDNGLLYLRARYYNPAAGVFTALDPFEGMWDDPMSINGYSYVHGNPVNLTDPSGEFIGGIVAVVAACPLCALAVAGILLLIWANAAREIAEECNKGLCSNPAPGREREGVPDNGGGTSPEDPFKGLPVWQRPPFNPPMGRPEPFLYPFVPPFNNPQPVPQPTQQPTQQPQPSPTPQVWRKHKTLGLIGLRDAGIDFDPMLDATLIDFTDRLNVILEPAYARAYMYIDWLNPSVRIATTLQPPDGFYQAIDKVRSGEVDEIHFNLTGILDNQYYINQGISTYTEFAYYGILPGLHRETAHELYVIKQDQFLCSKTLFYEHGLVTPSFTAKREICG
jgi:RHS repeat-associated protein